MNEFCAAPLLVLMTKEETVASLANPTWMENENLLFKYRVKSEWLCDEMDAYEKTHGFVYNLAFKLYIEEKEGWPASDENASPLAILIYNGQHFRGHDALIRAGFKPLDQSMIEQAFTEKKRIEFKGDSIFGEFVKLLTPRKIGETIYAMEPRKRKFAVKPSGQPCRLVA